MSSSTIIIDYLGEGTLAARPAAPALPTGGIGLYYATDNGNTYLYDTGGTAWILLASSGSAVTARSVTAIGNTTGGTSSTTGPQSAMTYSGAGAVSVGFTNGTLIVSSPATVASATSMGRTYTGNTGGDSSSSTQAITGQTLSGAGIVTVGVSGGTQFISASSAASATNLNMSALGNTNQATSSFAETLTKLSVSATGALSAGFDTNGVLILSAAAGGASGTANSEVALGNTTGATSSTVQTLQSLSVSGAGGVSIGFSTTAANQGVMIVSGATTVASGTAENMAAIGNTFGATSSSVLTLTAMTVSATGGISAGFATTAAGAGVLELSVAPPIASATAQNITLLGNTNQATSSFADTITGRSISATGGLSAGFDTNGVLILSGGAGGAGSTSESVFALGNTTGATSSATQALSGVSFSGAGGVSIGFTTTGAGANVLQISGATAAGGGFTISSLEPQPLINGSFTNIPVAGGVWVAPFSVGAPATFNQIQQVAANITFPTLLFTRSASNFTFTEGLTFSQTNSYALYSSVSTTSNIFSTFSTTSGSLGIGALYSVSSNTSSKSISATWTFSFFQSGALSTITVSTSTTNSSTSTAATATISAASANLLASGIFAGVNGPIFVNFPFAISMPAGNYLLGQETTTGSSVTTTGGSMSFGAAMGWLNVSRLNAPFVDTGAGAVNFIRIGTATTISPMLGVGLTSSVGSVFPGTVDWRNLTGIDTGLLINLRPYFIMVNGT